MAALTHELAQYAFFPTATRHPLLFGAFQTGVAAKTNSNSHFDFEKLE
jgi:hypothetical protein